MMLVDTLTDPEILPMLVTASFEIMKAIAGGLLSSDVELLKIIPKLFTTFEDKIKDTDWKAIGIDNIKRYSKWLYQYGAVLLWTKNEDAGEFYR